MASTLGLAMLLSIGCAGLSALTGVASQGLAGVGLADVADDAHLHRDNVLVESFKGLLECLACFFVPARAEI